MADDDNNKKTPPADVAATPESTSFVPPSLASFISKAQATLDDVQSSLHFDSPESNATNNASVSMDQDTSFVSMREDEDDKKLKKHVLDKINNRSRAETNVDDNNKEGSILETANMLLDLVEEDEHISSSLEPSPAKAANDGANVSMSDFLSRNSSVASPVKSVSSPGSASKPASNNTNRDSGSSRASGWKNLIAGIPSKVSPSKTPVGKSVDAEPPAPSSAGKQTLEKSQASHSIGKDATPGSIIEKPTELSTVGSASLPKDPIITSPPIPTTIDPMAMSAALEVTSPLPVHETHKLAASTPELAPPSPWKNAFQSMVARLEDRVTPPTPDQQSTPSPVLAAKQSPPKDLTSDPDVSTTSSVAPSPVVPGSSPAPSQQSASRKESVSASTPSPAASLPKSGLKLSPSDSIRPQSADKSPVAESPAASLPNASPQLARQSGLILSPSDSLPKPSPQQTTRQSGLVLSPSDSLPEPINPAEALSPAASTQVQRQSGLILSPSYSIPVPSPSKEEKIEKVLSPVALEEKNVSGLTPEATPGSATKVKNNSTPTSVIAAGKSDAVSSPAMSSQVQRQSGLILSPSDSLSSPPKEELASLSSPAVPMASAKPAEAFSPTARKSGLVLSPSDSLPAPSPAKEEKHVQMSTQPASHPSSERNVSVSSPKPLLPPYSAKKKNQMLSPSQKMSPALEVKDSSTSASSLKEKNAAVSSPALSLPAKSPPIEKKDELPLPSMSQQKSFPKTLLPQRTPALKESQQVPSTKKGNDSPASTLPKSRSSEATKTVPPPPSSPPAVVKTLIPANVGGNDTTVPSWLATEEVPSNAPANPVEVSVESEQAKVSSSPVEQSKPVSASPPVSDTKPFPPLEMIKETTQQPVPVADDAFSPNKQPVVTGTPPTRGPVQASKSEASKRATQPRTTAVSGSTSRKSLPATRRSIARQHEPSISTTTAVYRKSTSTSSVPVVGSRLLQETASSQAHARAIPSSSSKSAPAATRNSVSSRLTQGTAASEARAKMASPTPKPVAPVRKQMSVEDGRAKARERVRQQKLAAERKRKEEAEAAKQASRIRSRTRDSTRTSEQARALAQERVKQQQAVAQARASSVKGKENQIRPPNHVPKSAASAPSSRVTSSRRPTIPKSPNFATKAVLGKPRAKSVPDDGSMKLDPNPISRASGSPTHSDRNKGSATRTSTGSSSSRRLTVPKAPRLSTTAKYGDKPPPSLREAKPLKTVSKPRPPPRKRENKVTQPVPFKFHSSKATTSVPVAAKETEPSLAERMELYTRKGLRDESSTSTVKRTYKPTIPKSPQFSAISHRALPKSSAEMEEEIMEYYKEHPFKAAPVGSGVSEAAHTGPTKPAPKRRLTQPVPFHFRADERAAHAKPPVGSPDPEAKDLEECKKQFHARPLPRTLSKPPLRKEVAPRALTTPKPFNFSTDRRIHTEPHGPTADDIEMSKQFHARPMPKTTYVGPGARSAASKSVATPTPRKYAGPPKLATSARAEPREASRMASQKNAEQLAKQKEQLALKRKREKHQEDMAKACLTSPTPNIEPFHLHSEARHEAYQKQLAEQLAQKEEEAKKRMLFTAKPLRLSDPPPPIHSDRPATTPRPFALRSVTRHERWRDERRQQLEAEERERQRLMNVKAIPLPGTTYKYSPVTPASKKKRGNAGSEERDLDSARKRAMEALQSAENEVQEGNVVTGRSLLGSFTGS